MNAPSWLAIDGTLLTGYLSVLVDLFRYEDDYCSHK